MSCWIGLIQVSESSERSERDIRLTEERSDDGRSINVLSNPSTD
jgi:hypothetical protein